MNEARLLEKNPRQIKKILNGLIDTTELNKLDQFLLDQTRLLVKLSENHLKFAISIKAHMYWRQKVSRSYYACYNASRAMRLIMDGSYSTDSSDHKKIDQLPADFPSRDVWGNFLSQFKADRNIADYDHISSTVNLNNSPSVCVQKSIDFCKEVKLYLHVRYGI